MSYTYNAGDPVTVLLTTEPNGATEPVSILDDAVKQIKKYLNDATVGPQALLTALTTTVTTNAATAAAATAAVASDLADGQVRLEALETNEAGKVIVTHPGAQSVIAGAGIAVVTFDTEEFDPSNSYNPVSFTYTAPMDGLYCVSVQVAVDTAASGTPTDIVHQLDIFVDAAAGATHRLSANDDETEKTLQLTRMFNLTAGQTLAVKYTLTLGSGTMTVDINPDPRETVLQICRLAA